MLNNTSAQECSVLAGFRAWKVKPGPGNFPLFAALVSSGSKQEVTRVFCPEFSPGRRTGALEDQRPVAVFSTGSLISHHNYAPQTRSRLIIRVPVYASVSSVHSGH